MKVRSFLIENSAGERLDLSASPDLFAFNPEGLGVSIDNDLVSSGGSFLVNKREIVVGELTLSLLIGALEINPYRMYDRLINVLSKPPYNIVYETEVGSWRRSCIVKELTKTEINALNVMTESITFECTTPWYNYVMNEFPEPPKQSGDGKIYSKHTNWKYADDGYKTPPITGYTENEYWEYDPTVVWPGKNLAGNIYYDELVFRNNGIIFTFPIQKDSVHMAFEADIIVNKVIGNVSIDGHTTAPIKSDTKHVRVTVESSKSGSKGVISINGITGDTEIVLKNIFVSYSTSQYPNIMIDKFSKPTYWNSEDKNLLGNQNGVMPTVYGVADGVSDSRFVYNVTPANYPMIYPYIYEAKYTYDYRFREWYVIADKISMDAIVLRPGNKIDYTAYVGNSRNSEDILGVKLIFLNRGAQILTVDSGYSLSKGDSDVVQFRSVEVPLKTTEIQIHLYKKNDIPSLNMGATFGSKRLFINDTLPVLLTTTTTRDYLLESDWVLADNPEKVNDGEYYGYIYNYVYDGDEKPANTYLIENDSLYLRTAVNSPCEITIHGPAKKPRWELLVDSQVKFTDGFNLDVPEDYKLIVSSLPNEQRAVLVDSYGKEANVYQQQNLAMTNFIRIPPGMSILMVYGVEGNIEFRYREERDVV